MENYRKMSHSQKRMIQKRSARYIGKNFNIINFIYEHNKCIKKLLMDNKVKYGGITGFIDSNSNNSANIHTTVKKMTNLITYRGPDSGSWISDCQRVCLGNKDFLYWIFLIMVTCLLCVTIKDLLFPITEKFIILEK